MNPTNHIVPHSAVPTTVAKTAWIAPVVQTIAAGQAETGTRSAPDGQFTSS